MSDLYGDNMSTRRRTTSIPSEEVVPKKSVTLEDLKAMFGEVIESEVIEDIWQNCNQNGETALVHLSEISPSKPKVPPASESLLQSQSVTQTASRSSWSNLLSSYDGKPFSQPPSVKPKPVKTVPTIVDIILQRIQQPERIVVIMRGVPGSGKSFLAKKLQGNGVVLSTDDFFNNHLGQYVFDARKLSEAHDWNQRRAEREIKAGTNPVIIDNTNLEVWEMQPYVCMALRCNYSVELVEPDTPWRTDVRVLSQKNSHHVPREKIAMMLEKQSVPINIAHVIDECRRKLNLRPQSMPAEARPMPSLVAALKPNKTLANQNNRPEPLVQQEEVSVTRSQSFSASSNVGNLTNDELLDKSPIQQLEEKKFFNPDSFLGANERFFNFHRETEPPALVSVASALFSPPTTEDIKPLTSDVSIQTSLSDATLCIIPARNRSIQMPSRIVPDFRKKSSKLLLDKGCNTEEMVEDLATRKALTILKLYFPTLDTKDLADVLKQCKGDIDWAVNQLLDSGYECAHEVLHDFQTEDLELEEEEEINEGIHLQEETSPSAKEDEVRSTSSEESSSAPSASSMETEAVRRHVENCFQLTNTVSDSTRRICGKDYNQFRAAQLQKSRSQIVNESSPIRSYNPNVMSPNGKATKDIAKSIPFPSLGDQGAFGFDPLYDMGATGGIGVDLLQSVPVGSPPSSEEGIKDDDGAMIPMVLDPSFVQQLVSLFGAPDLKNGSVQSNQRVAFDIPWSLAEQIYLYWVTSRVNLVSEEDELNESFQEEDSQELQQIIDMELAMQIVQDQKNAERKELRESMSTNLSFKMLQENYPNVDPLALDAVFEANNFNYSDTVTALNASLGTKPRPNKNVVQKSVTIPVSAKKESALAPVQKREVAKVESRDLRAEAFMYNQKQKEFQAKAREQHRRGMSAVAMYYSAEARKYGELHKECNQIAALQILQEKNADKDERTIDLHALHVAEALSCLESFIAENLREGKGVIQAITGRGKNSINGPRIKPAVITFLKQKNYGFEEFPGNPGMLRIFLRRNTHR